MVVIIPVKKPATEGSGIFQRAEQEGEIGAIFQGFKLRFVMCNTT
jgi:hypothetical protein